MSEEPKNTKAKTDDPSALSTPQRVRRNRWDQRLEQARARRQQVLAEKSAARGAVGVSGGTEETPPPKVASESDFDLSDVLARASFARPTLDGAVASTDPSVDKTSDLISNGPKPEPMGLFSAHRAETPIPKGRLEFSESDQAVFVPGRSHSVDLGVSETNSDTADEPPVRVPAPAPEVVTMPEALVPLAAASSVTEAEPKTDKPGILPLVAGFVFGACLAFVAYSYASRDASLPDLPDSAPFNANDTAPQGNSQSDGTAPVFLRPPATDASNSGSPALNLQATPPTELAGIALVNEPVSVPSALFGLELQDRTRQATALPDAPEDASLTMDADIAAVPSFEIPANVPDAFVSEAQPSPQAPRAVVSLRTQQPRPVGLPMPDVAGDGNIEARLGGYLWNAPPLAENDLSGPSVSDAPSRGLPGPVPVALIGPRSDTAFDRSPSPPRVAASANVIETPVAPVSVANSDADFSIVVATSPNALAPKPLRGPETDAEIVTLAFNRVPVAVKDTLGASLIAPTVSDVSPPPAMGRPLGLDVVEPVPLTQFSVPTAPVVMGAAARIDVAKPLSANLFLLEAAANKPLPVFGGGSDPRPEIVLAAAVLTTALPDRSISIRSVATAEPLPMPRLDAVRLHLMVPTALAVDDIETLQTRAEQVGYQMGNTIPVPVNISSTHLRFFHPEDEEAALVLAERLAVPARDFTSFAPSPLEGSIELWFAGLALPEPPTLVEVSTLPDVPAASGIAYCVRGDPMGPDFERAPFLAGECQWN